MIVKLYYDDCRKFSDDDYPCKKLTVDNFEDFVSILFNESPYITCDYEEGYQVFLNKDRIIEIWIKEEE